MKINNAKLQLFISALSQLAQLRTGSKIAYSVAYTLKSASRTWEVIEAVRVPLNARYEAEREQVEKEWAELLSSESEFDARTVATDDLDACIDADKITASMIINLEGFII